VTSSWKILRPTRTAKLEFSSFPWSRKSGAGHLDRAFQQDRLAEPDQDHDEGEEVPISVSPDAPNRALTNDHHVLRIAALSHATLAGPPAVVGATAMLPLQQFSERCLFDCHKNEE
jgi:hypothetical protein